LYGFVGNDAIDVCDYLGLFLPIHPNDWLRAFHKNNPNLFKGLSKEETEELKKVLIATRDLGCVGLTCLILGQPWPDLSNCYMLKEQAEDRKKQMETDKTCSTCTNMNGETSRPRLFSIHFRNDKGRDKTNSDVQYDHTGKAYMENWDYEARPKGGFNFDFGYLGDDGRTMVHANHMKYSKEEIEEKRKEAIAENRVFTPDAMWVKVSTIEEWQRSYSDFNDEVWCVACEKNDLKK